MNLYFLGFTDLLLSFCFDGISKKRKNALLSGALLSFCVVCEIFLCTSFQTFLRRDFVTALYLVSIFATKPFVYTPCYTHNQIFSFGRCWGTFGALTPTTFRGKSFQLRIQQCALCCCHCCGRVAMSVSGFLCTNGRSFLLQSFRHEKVVLFTLSGQFLGWLTLRLSFEAVQRSTLPSFYLYLLFPTACFTFNLSSLLIFPQKPNRRCSREIQASKDAKHHLSGPTLPWSKLPVQTDFSSPYHKPRTFFPNLSHSNHHMVACSYVMKV